MSEETKQIVKEIIKFQEEVVKNSTAHQNSKLLDRKLLERIKKVAEAASEVIDYVKKRNE